MSDSTPRLPDPFARATTLDARSLRGLAHPLRVRILTLLQDRGPATGKTVAEWVGASSASASYHLRQLETHGFIEEDPDLGTSRERWWRARHEGFRFPEHLDTDEPELSTAVRLALAASWSEELAAAVDLWAAQPEGWREAQVMSGRRTRLTLEELAEFRREVRALFDRYTRETGAPGSRPVHIQFAAFPDPGEHGADAGDAT
ncbi:MULTISPECIES: winged helix-turn-helix domain-containing protein [unclassified Nocardiopsis]|uniref:winged helix-turn-helix domain-containing protein n=1 Tax=unclassified Nocardiopsis TaxID=2649073 RepID=UPI001356BF57|nr:MULTISPECIES: winged helix-turn-helix domain-containing protein [unclassified Nocardiopsis]